MANKPFLEFDTSEIDNLAVAFAQTSFSFKGIEDKVQQIIANSNLEQFTSEGAYGQKLGFPKWDDLKPSTLAQKEKLGFGKKQKLERTGQLGDVVINPKVTTDSSGFIMFVKFSGEHAGLIPIFQKRFPLIIITEPDFEALGILALDNFITDFSSRLKVKKVK